MKFLKKWAETRNHSAGPFAGSRTKRVPAALLAEGMQPGSGPKISAPEMNFLLNELIRGHQLQARSSLVLRPLLDWEDRTETSQPTSSGCAFDPNTGAVWICLQSGGSARVTLWGTEATLAGTVCGEDPAVCTVWDSSNEFHKMICVGKDGSGDLMITYSTDRRGYTLSSGTGGGVIASAGISGLSRLRLSPDLTNGTVAGVELHRGEAPVAFYVNNLTGVPALNSAGTLTGDCEHGGAICTSPSGVTIIAYGDDTTGVRIYRSTDGGQSYSAGGSLSGGTVRRRVLSMDYVRDFVDGDLASVFVLATTPDDNAAGDIEIWTSSNGVTWSLKPMTFAAGYSGSYEPGQEISFMFGHMLFISNHTQGWIALDMFSGATVGFASTPYGADHDYRNAQTIFTDGYRLLSNIFNTPSSFEPTVTLATDLLKMPPCFDGAEMP